MADDTDKELKIHVVTTADTSGGEKAVEEFEKIRERMEGVGQGARDMREFFYELDKILPGSGQALEAAFTGPLGYILAAGFAVEKVETAIMKMEDRLEDLQNEDLAGPLNQAQALAETYEGIAKAVQKANDAFNSPESMFRRGQQGIEAEHGLSETRKLQLELGNKNTEATNAQIQADEARRKAEGFKIPSDAEAKAEADALRKQAKEHQDAADAARKEAIARQDFSATALAGQGYGGGFLGSIVHPVEAFKAFIAALGGRGSTQFITEAQQKAADEQAQAITMSQHADEIEKQVKLRQTARSEAEEKAKAATTIQRETSWENDPNNMGSMAWKLAQQQKFNSGESAVSAALQRATSDLSTTGPGAQSALKDAAEAIRTAFSIIQQLAADGDDVRQLRRELEAIKAQMGSMPTQTFR